MWFNRSHFLITSKSILSLHCFPHSWVCSYLFLKDSHLFWLSSRIRRKHGGGCECWFEVEISQFPRLCLNLDFGAEGVCDWRLSCLKMEMGDSSKKFKAKKIGYNGLIDHLFSWTLEDVLYDDFYKDEVLSSFHLLILWILIVFYFLGSCLSLICHEAVIVLQFLYFDLMILWWWTLLCFSMLLLINRWCWTSWQY